MTGTGTVTGVELNSPSGLWENIYLHNGTFYVLSSEPSSVFPGTGSIMSAHPTLDDRRPPAGEDRFRHVDRIDARRVMRDGAMLMGGNSVGCISLRILGFPSGWMCLHLGAQCDIERVSGDIRIRMGHLRDV